MKARRPLFVLDESFPQPILKQALTSPVLELDVRLLDDFAPGLSRNKVPDHELIRSLWMHGAKGMVSTDPSMVELPQVVMMVEQTRFSLVTVELGHDGIAASGLFLAHVHWIAGRYTWRRPQVWELSAKERQPLHTRDLRERILRRTGAPDPRDFKLTLAELRAAPFA